MTSGTIGWQPVRNVNQNEARRRTDALLDKIFTDKTIGKDTVRPRFTNVMGHVRRREERNVYSMDRLSRNLIDPFGTICLTEVSLSKSTKRD